MQPSFLVRGAGPCPSGNGHGCSRRREPFRDLRHLHRGRGGDKSFPLSTHRYRVADTICAKRGRIAGGHGHQSTQWGPAPCTGLLRVGAVGRSGSRWSRAHLLQGLTLELSRLRATDPQICRQPCQVDRLPGSFVTRSGAAHLGQHAWMPAPCRGRCSQQPLVRTTTKRSTTVLWRLLAGLVPRCSRARMGRGPYSFVLPLGAGVEKVDNFFQWRLGALTANELLHAWRSMVRINFTAPQTCKLCPGGYPFPYHIGARGKLAISCPSNFLCCMPCILFMTLRKGAI